MSESKNADLRKARRVPRAEPKQRTAPHPGRSLSADLGQALRSAYDDALQEKIPDEFRELLDKLG